MATKKINILDESLPILIRESLDDQGNASYTNHSPDIIVQKFKLDDPLEALKNSYDSDISQDGDGSGKMYIYVRFKNTTDQTLDGFYIHLYCNHFGLYNVPKRDWTRYEMKTEYNKPVYIESLGPKEIGVTPAFIYENNENKEKCKYPNCFVAVATRAENPDYSSIKTLEKYVTLINKKSVAARNVCVSYRNVKRQEQRIYFRNPDAEKSALLSFYIKVHEKSTSSGIKYGISCPELGIKEEKTYTVGDKRSSYISCVVTVPKGYSGQLICWYESFKGDQVDIQIYLLKFKELEEECGLFDQYGIDLKENFSEIAETASISVKSMKTIILAGCRINARF